jgi:hypothetical protein
VGFPGSIGLDSDRPDVRLRYDWKSARYLVNDRSPLDCREAEQFYLTDAELRARDDMRRVPTSALTPTDYQPNTIRMAGPNAFDDTQQADELPANWSPNGRPINLPPPASDAAF